MILSGGWIMVPIILSSVIGLAITIERFWALQAERIAPRRLVPQIAQWYRAGQLDAARIEVVRSSSPLGRILAAGLVNLNHSREVMKESIEDAGRQVVIELEKFLNALGTIASVSPLLGLLGTVIGMIKMFGSIDFQGVTNTSMLASGIAQSLVTTAGGLFVAIPAVMFYRYFRAKVDALVLKMEAEAIKLVEVIHGEREEGTAEEAA